MNSVGLPQPCSMKMPTASGYGSASWKTRSVSFPIFSSARVTQTRPVEQLGEEEELMVRRRRRPARPEWTWRSCGSRSSRPEAAVGTARRSRRAWRRRSRTTMIDQLAMFCQRVLTCSPMSGLSFSSRIRNTSAAGSSVTATTCTKMVIASCTWRARRSATTSARREQHAGGRRRRTTALRARSC